MKFIRVALWSNLIWLVYVLGVTSAVATPYLSIHSQDHPIAVSHTHLYVMRHVTDNMGYYQAERSKTYILKLETKTSKLVEFHKLQEGLQSEDSDSSGVTANQSFNLFTYLENEKAFQIGLLKSRDHEKISVNKRKTTFALSRKYTGQIDGTHQQVKEQSTIYNSNIRVLLKSSLAPIMSDYIGPIPDPIPNKEIYSISQNFDPQSGGMCKITQVVNAPLPISKWRYDKRSEEFITNVTCRSAGDGLYVDAVLPLALKFTAGDVAWVNEDD